MYFRSVQFNLFIYLRSVQFNLFIYFRIYNLKYKRSISKYYKIYLLYFNCTFDDIILKNKIEF